MFVAMFGAIIMKYAKTIDWKHDENLRSNVIKGSESLKPALQAIQIPESEPISPAPVEINLPIPVTDNSLSPTLPSEPLTENDNKINEQ
jgi:hypothetical protein